MAFLTEPSIQYKTSFLAAMREFQAEGRYPEIHYPDLERDFRLYVQDLLERPTQAAPGKVPESFFWLVNGEDFIGRVSIRHRLNERLLQFGGHIGYEIRPTRRRQGYGTLILKLGLEKAKALGIRRALLTCDNDNVGSARIIEANGGILENVVLLSGRHVPTRRYWIEVE